MQEIHIRPILPGQPQILRPPMSLPRLRQAIGWWLYIKGNDPVRLALNRGFAILIGIGMGLLTLLLIGMGAFGWPLGPDRYWPPILLVSWWLNRRGTSHGIALLVITGAVMIAAIFQPASYVMTQGIAVQAMFLLPIILAAIFISPASGIWACGLQCCTLLAALFIHGTPIEQIELFAFYGSLNLAALTALLVVGGFIFKHALRTSITANATLATAYDATIEGWARALDLRDTETEGHSRRVTELTLSLARTMGINEADLVHIRRGALLHDIGKMAVPDAILQKPGPLTPEERAIMEQHPVAAYQMLAPIAHLRPALDIPYYHHERWDGTGYPGRLRGTEIPLAARLFAVVDVWDALLSDRPYRKGWPVQQVYTHIQAQSGSHFDPQVVETFLKLMGYKPEAYDQVTENRE